MALGMMSAEMNADANSTDVHADANTLCVCDGRAHEGECENRCY